MHKLEELKVWHRAMELTVLVFQVVSDLPPEEKYGLASQIKRSVVSIASNIAEGAGRNTDKEFYHFLGMASGSSYELLTQILIAAKLDMINKQQAEVIYLELTHIQKMIYGFQRKLAKNFK